ncbi:MAG TPA: hypothetical protein VK806_09510 [Bacteroidia bacterium]|jgi:Spy/CpxP family protein refolding chaperone|nr:hypothetical protein [Bacteroidia bacterium]
MNTRLTNTILIVLLLLNAAFVGFWWLHHGHSHRMHPNMNHTAKGQGRVMGMDIIVKELNLDSAQKRQVEGLWKEHSATMGKYQAQITQFEKQTLECMTHGITDSSRAFVYADSAGMVRNAIQKEHFRYMARINQLCNADQKKKFDEMVKNMIMRVSHHWNPHDSNMKQDSM